ncbi:MAG TPA: GWxTD domain-containing protein [Rubricoccaceae bacterium]|jgi:GWxTD domain-containing protein
MPTPRPALRLALLTLAALAVPAAQAQAGASAPQAPEVAAAEADVQAGQPAAAVARLDAYLLTAPDDAEAQYLLARLLYPEDSPVRDARRAARAIDRAVALQPNNVLYLVAQLEGQRLERTNILLDLLRARRRYVIAERILALDPDNAYAHEELGTWAIRDYYQYRNAIALPGLVYDAPDTGRSLQAPPDESPSADVAVEGEGVLIQELVRSADPIDFEDANAAYADDRFDLDVLRAQNVGVVTFETRARRAYDTATEHLRAALRSDPRRRSVYDHVVRLALISGRWDDAAPDLREMDVQFPTDGRTALYLGLAAQRTGRFEDADAAFTRALRDLPAADAAVFTDLALILPPDEVPAYRADPDAFAQRYWTSRDPRYLNTVNERRTEHYARLVEADLLYRSDALDRPGWTTERGLLHVRFGPPQSDVIIDGAFAQVVEVYQGLAELFGAADGPSDAERSANRFNVWTYADGLRLVFEDPNRNGQFRLYSPPAYAYGLASARDPARMDFVQIARNAVRETPERFTFAPPGRSVELPARVAAFKGTGDRADLYLTYGVPLAAEAGAPGEDVDLTLRTGTFLVGASRDVLAERRRTVYGLRAAQIVQFAETRLWTTTEPLVAPAGPNEVSVEFETAGGGAFAVQRRAVTVPDFRQPGLHLSDVMLAYDIDSGGAVAPGRVVRGGVAVLPAPWGVFEAGAPVFVYVEAYGLTLQSGRSDFEVTAELVPRDASTGIRRLGRRILGRRETGVASTLEAQGATPDETQSLRLSTDGQPPGLYTLTVTVRDRLSGEAAERETDLLLEGGSTP